MEYKDLAVYNEALTFLCNLSYIKTVHSKNTAIVDNVNYSWQYIKNGTRYAIEYIKVRKENQYINRFVLINHDTNDCDVINDIYSFISENNELELLCSDYVYHHNALHYLISLPHYKTQTKRYIIYHWNFVKNGKQYELQYNKSNIIYTNITGIYRECIRQFCVVENKECCKCVKDIDIYEFINTYKNDLENTMSNFETNKHILQEIYNMIGRHHFQAMYDITWYIKAKKLKVMINLNKLQDLNCKTIELKYDTQGEDDRNKWDSKMITYAQLVKFLKKYKKELQELPQNRHDIDEITNNISNINVNVNDDEDEITNAYIDVTAKKQTNPKKPCNLFINIPKKDILRIQSCKDVCDPYEYLLIN